MHQQALSFWLIKRHRALRLWMWRLYLLSTACSYCCVIGCQLPPMPQAAEEACKGGRETAHLGEGAGQGAGVGQQVQLAQQVLQVVPGQDALDHVGAVQAVDAIDAEHASLAFGQPRALQEEAKAFKVGPELVPQQDQPAEGGKPWC